LVQKREIGRSFWESIRERGGNSPPPFLIGGGKEGGQ